VEWQAIDPGTILKTSSLHGAIFENEAIRGRISGGDAFHSVPAIEELPRVHKQQPKCCGSWLAQCPCSRHLDTVKAKKPATSKIQPETSGTKLIAKYRPRMSRLTDAERQQLMARGLQIIYGDTPAAKPAHRG
jgi:hypothetical protein